MAIDRDLVYLRHILVSIGKIEEYVGRGGKDLFDKDTAIQDAIIKQTEIIGEASRKISEKLRKDHPDLPWRGMVGMRDKLVHDYMGVDLGAVWKTATTDIPNLKNLVEKILVNY